MFVYLSLIIFCTFNGFLIDKIKNKKDKRVIALCSMIFLFLFLVSALRYDVGKDYMDTYVFSYKKIVYGYKNVRMDIAVKIIYRLMAKIRASYQWIFVITSFFINFFACKSIITQSNNCKLSFMIYLCGTFYFFSMNGVRQSIAITIFYYSFKYIKEKNFKMYFILNIIGAMFHSSALIFIPLYFIVQKKYKFKSKIVIILVTLFATKSIVPLVASVLLKTHYAMYLTNGAYTAQQSLNFSMYLNILIFVIYEFAIKKIECDEQAIIYSNIHFCGILVSLLATSLPLVIRIFMSFRFVEYLSVPYLVELQSKYKRIIELFVMLFYFAYFVWGVGIQNGNAVLPYKMIFSEIW